MPAGRPPKRPPGDGMDALNPLDNHPSSSAAKSSKLPRIERGPEDFSSVVKNKLQSYTRTGQACDRCKVRKIRCDALPDGCTHCMQQNLDCYVTDRVTGRTERRGYLQQLEREKNGLLTHIRDLERLLESKGVQVRQYQSSSTANEPPPSLYGSGSGGGGSSSSSSYDIHGGGLGAATSGSKAWEQFGSLWVKDFGLDSTRANSSSAANGPFLSTSSPFSTTGTTTSPPLSTLRPLGAHLGVVKDSAPLSAVEGTQLSILGTTIDITSFDAPDMDGPPVGASRASPIYNKSLQSFYNSITKINPPLDAPLPSREDAFSYSEWWFTIAGSYLPVLHKPTYFKLLARIYDEPGFKPSTADLVIVHMVFAMIYYQFGVRNVETAERKAQLNDLSNKHYHWSVDKAWDIASDLSLSSIQALILIATHCRSFPKPGPAWLIANLTWTRAIEMNLHRAYLPKGEPTTLENEMRKRLWWSLFMVVVILYGRLGKPMPIRAEDFDVEYPLVLPDECITEGGVNTEGGGRAEDCYWILSAQGFKLAYLFLDMWNNVYPVRQDPNKYVTSMRRLEEKFRLYHSEIPSTLKVDPSTGKNPAATAGRDNHVSLTYLQATGCEFLLCLYHPSRCMITDPAFVAENNRKCDDAAKQLLTLANELRTARSLDTTWYQIAVYVGAMFTLLASGWERRAEISHAELGELREYMNVGLSVVREILNYIGAPDSRVLNQITGIIDRTISSIEQDMSSRQPPTSSRTQTTNTSQYSLQSHQQQQQQQQHPRPKHDDYTRHRPGRSATSTPTPLDHMQLPRVPAQPTSSYYHHSPLTQINTAYSQLGYPDLGNSAGPGPPTSTSSYEHPPSQSYLYAPQAAGTSPHSSTHHSPMVGYAAASSHAAAHATTHPHQQHHTHHQHPHHQTTSAAAAGWMHAGGVPSNGTNPWNEWASAMVDTSAPTAAAVMGLSQRDSGASVAGEMHHGGAGAPHHGGVAAPGQAGGGPWPMMVFHHPVSGP